MKRRKRPNVARIAAPITLSIIDVEGATITLRLFAALFPEQSKRLVEGMAKCRTAYDLNDLLLSMMPPDHYKITVVRRVQPDNGK